MYFSNSDKPLEVEEPFFFYYLLFYVFVLLQRKLYHFDLSHHIRVNEVFDEMIICFSFPYKSYVQGFQSIRSSPYSANLYRGYLAAYGESIMLLIHDIEWLWLSTLILSLSTCQ